MADPAVVIENPLEARQRLRQLGIPGEALTTAIRNGLSAKAGTTANHPPTYGGMAMWAEMVRSLRDDLLPRGWTKDDRRNFCVVISPDGSVAIAVARGDENTGDADETPSTRYARGIATRDAVNRNLLLPWDENAISRNAALDGEDSSKSISTYFLLHTMLDEQVRFELSRPTSINTTGYVETWSERIVLPPIDLDPVPLKSVDEPPVEPVVNVKKRA